MSILSGISEFFGLDIGSTTVRLVQLKNSGSSKVLVKYAYLPLEGNIALSDAPADKAKLAAAIKQLLEQAQVTTKNVAVSLPSSKVFTTVADIDRLSDAELAKAIKFQAPSLIPTPLAESKIDWALLGDSPADKAKVEILLSSVLNKYVEERLDLLEGIGLNVIGFEPENLATVRSLLAPNTTGAQIILNIGTQDTDLVAVLNGSPRLTRAIPVGTDALFKAAAQNLNVDAKQAEQFVLRFGLSQDKLDGQVVRAISGMVDNLISEVQKSVQFFGTRYTNVKIDRIVVTGGASVIPEFPVYVANKFGVNVEIGNAWRGVGYPKERQNELAAISNQFSVAVGLAERKV